MAWISYIFNGWQRDLEPCLAVFMSFFSEYDTKQFDGEIPVMLEIWGMQDTPLLPSLPRSLGLEVVAPDKALSRNQIELCAWIKQNSLRWDCFDILTAYLCLSEFLEMELLFLH